MLVLKRRDVGKEEDHCCHGDVVGIVVGCDNNGVVLLEEKLVAARYVLLLRAKEI